MKIINGIVSLVAFIYVVIDCSSKSPDIGEAIIFSVICLSSQISYEFRNLEDKFRN